GVRRPAEQEPQPPEGDSEGPGVEEMTGRDVRAPRQEQPRRKPVGHKGGPAGSPRGTPCPSPLSPGRSAPPSCPCGKRPSTKPSRTPPPPRLSAWPPPPASPARP